MLCALRRTRLLGSCAHGRGLRSRYRPPTPREGPLEPWLGRREGETEWFLWGQGERQQTARREEDVAKGKRCPGGACQRRAPMSRNETRGGVLLKSKVLTPHTRSCAREWSRHRHSTRTTRGHTSTTPSPRGQCRWGVRLCACSGQTRDQRGGG
jgi:hypothetical protein